MTTIDILFSLKEKYLQAQSIYMEFWIQRIERIVKYRFNGKISIKTTSNAFAEPRSLEAAIWTTFKDDFLLMTAQVYSPFVIAAYNDPRTWAMELALSETQKILANNLLGQLEKIQIESPNNHLRCFYNPQKQLRFHYR